MDQSAGQMLKRVNISSGPTARVHPTAAPQFYSTLVLWPVTDRRTSLRFSGREISPTINRQFPLPSLRKCRLEKQIFKVSFIRSNREKPPASFGYVFLS